MSVAAIEVNKSYVCFVVRQNLVHCLSQYKHKLQLFRARWEAGGGKATLCIDS